MIFDDIDKRLRQHDSRLNWMESDLTDVRNIALSVKESLGVLNDLVESMKKKPMEKKKNVLEE
jgi:hypothetical protein